MQPFRLMAVLLAAFSISGPAAAQDYFAGKTLRIIVGLEAGGTVDTMARLFLTHLGRHIPGNPAIVLKTMLGGSGTMIGMWLGMLVLGILNDGFNLRGISSNKLLIILGAAILLAMIANTYLARLRSAGRLQSKS